MIWSPISFGRFPFFSFFLCLSFSFQKFSSDPDLSRRNWNGMQKVVVGERDQVRRAEGGLDGGGE
jgi:hypothetical protein